MGETATAVLICLALVAPWLGCIGLNEIARRTG